MEIDFMDVLVDIVTSKPDRNWVIKFGVRVCHTPTGISVTEFSDRSQHRNRAVAFERLDAILKRAKVKGT